MLRRIIGPKHDEVTGSRDNYLMRCLIFCSADQEERDGQGMNMYEREVHTGFMWGKLMERNHLEDPGLDGKIILRWIFRKVVAGEWTRFMWLRIGIYDGFL